MTLKKKQFKAHLIKYRQSDMEDAIWFWVNPSSGKTLSPQFESQEDAEKWFDDVILVHNKTFNLLDRIKNGKFYNVSGRIDIGDTISSKKANDCPFTLHLEDDILTVEVLATSMDEAKERVMEYFEILEWLDDE